MGSSRLPELIDIGRGAAKRLAAFCASKGAALGAGALRLVADRNTWRAMGEEAERELRAVGLSTRATIFEEPTLAADAHSVFRLLIDDDPRERLYVAVGSGTITDIVRFACHRTGRDFVSLATAPSVDAYSSIVAPVVIDGMKRTVPAAAPIAVFADTACLSAAPRPMIAAGFGDMLAKFTAVADWRLGALLWGEPYDEAVARRSEASARACVDAVQAIGAAKSEGVEALMAAVVESGLCMAEAGHSRPASGAEHQYSHFWEMRLLRDGLPPILHGLKVGIGTLEAARLWDGIKSLSKAEATRRLGEVSLPDLEAEVAAIRAAYGPDTEEILGLQARFLAMDEGAYAELRGRIAAAWDEIREFAAKVPDAPETARLLAAAGCPLSAAELGLRVADIADGLASAHYLRDRFTVRKLARMLGLA